MPTVQQIEDLTNLFQETYADLDEHYRERLVEILQDISRSGENDDPSLGFLLISHWDQPEKTERIMEYLNTEVETGAWVVLGQGEGLKRPVMQWDFTTIMIEEVRLKLIQEEGT